VKNILRIASVAGESLNIDVFIHYVINNTPHVLGQSFKLHELCQVLSGSSTGVSNERISDASIIEILTASDPYHFISKDIQQVGSTTIMSFSHYLIQQGIQSTMLPQKREAIHCLFADYYESTLTPSNKKDHLPALVYHLLKVQGQTTRKLKFVNEAFNALAELYRPVEGFMFYEILQNVANEMGGMNVFTALERARHHRLLSQLNLEIMYVKMLNAPYDELLNTNQRHDIILAT
jgi:hypothetical protein